MLLYFLISCLLICTEGHPKYRRYRRDDDVGGITYAPCKDTYTQCPEWKKSGMCDMPQYKDYMPLVCTDTCGFCKEVKQEENAEFGAANKDQIKAPKEKATDAGEVDKVQGDYQEQLKRYYDSIDQQQKAYQTTIQPHQPTDTNPTNPGISTAETGTINSGVTSPATADISSPVNTETAPSNIASPYPGSSNASPLNPQVAPAYQPYGSQPSGSQPYGSQPYPPYGPYNNPDNSSSSSSSSSSGSKSSTSSTSSSDSSTSTSTTVGLSPLNSTNQTEPAGNISVSDASSLPSKVAPETPSLPALPPLLVLPPISESLLVEEPSKSNSTTSLDKEPSEKQKTNLQQVADSRPYAPERGSPTKNEGTKIKHKTQQKAEPDRKVITEDQQTNEMTKSESKHLAVIVHGHNLEDEDNEEEDEPKIIKAFSDDPGKLQMKGYIKKKNMDLDLKDAKQKFATKHEKPKESENEDAVFKHDEKSVSVSGSGAGGTEENFEDLNYITDFNPDDFDMDLPEISHKDLISQNDKRNPLEFLEDHPLFSRSGIQKARSEITAPTIIDATEHGVGENAEILNDAKDHIRSKIHTRSKSSSKTVPKAEIREANKEEASSGSEDSNDEENSGVSSEEKSNYKVTFDGDEEKYGGKESTVERNNIVKKHTEKSKATKKSKTKTTTSKGKTNANKKSKVASTKAKIDEKKNEKDKKDSKHLAKEKSEVSELMSEKGDTAAIRNKKAEKKSSTTLIKKSHKHEEKSVLTPRKEIPKIKDETTVAAQRTVKKPDTIETTIADLSGAGSGEIDTDILSGEAPFRSTVESGDDAEEATEEEGEDDEEEEESPAHQRQNFQLHGDPEMVDLKPKNTNPQPDLNDFPDKEDEKSSFTEEQEGSTTAPVTEAGGKEKEEGGEGELDDIKIEELLNPKDDDSKKKKKKEKAKTSLKEGKISMVLQQNYNQHYDNKDAPGYQMLSGNIKKDIEKMVKGTAVNDIAFSEVSVEGNPRQSGKTKVSFNVDASSNEWMKKLLKLVDGGDIDGLRVIKGSLEIEEE